MTIKEVFEKAENGTLTFEQFQEATKDAKFVDVKEGGYVSKNKYDADLAAKDTEISTLNETVATRNTDLQTLQTKLSEAGTDAAKLNSLSGEFETLKTKYEEDTKAYQQKLDKQAYEFAVKEYANSKEFSSSAAKRDFISSMINENLKMKKDGSAIIGADDFLKAYSEENSDAFLIKDNPPEPNPNDMPLQPEQFPQFINPTQGGDHHTEDLTKGFASAFHFTPIRPIPEK